MGNAQIRVYIVGVNGALVRQLVNRETRNHIVHVVCYVIPSYIHVVTIHNVQKMSRILPIQSHAISTRTIFHLCFSGIAISTFFSYIYSLVIYNKNSRKFWYLILDVCEFKKKEKNSSNRRFKYWTRVSGQKWTSKVHSDGTVMTTTILLKFPLFLTIKVCNAAVSERSLFSSYSREYRCFFKIHFTISDDLNAKKKKAFLSFQSKYWWNRFRESWNVSNNDSSVSFFFQ